MIIERNVARVVNDYSEIPVSAVPAHLYNSTKSFAKEHEKGLGTTNKQSPISVKFPPRVDQVLRAMDCRSDYIRRAVIDRLKDDKIL